MKKMLKYKITLKTFNNYKKDNTKNCVMFYTKGDHNMKIHEFSTKNKHFMCLFFYRSTASSKNLAGKVFSSISARKIFFSYRWQRSVNNKSIFYFSVLQAPNRRKFNAVVYFHTK